MGKENKYPRGYWPKIEYWSNTLAEAIKRKDVDTAVNASEKLKYFTQKQAELDGITAKF